MVFTVGVLIYIQVKPYPMDYVDGVLLVDPQKMMNDTFKGAGGFIGLMIGSYIERHYVKYEIPTGAASLPVMTGVGTACVFIWEQYLSDITFKVWFGAHWGNLLSYLILMVLAVAVYPLIIMKSEKKSGTEAA